MAEYNQTSTVSRSSHEPPNGSALNQQWGRRHRWTSSSSTKNSLEEEVLLYLIAFLSTASSLGPEEEVLDEFIRNPHLLRL